MRLFNNAQSLASSATRMFKNAQNKLIKANTLLTKHIIETDDYIDELEVKINDAKLQSQQSLNAITNNSKLISKLNEFIV